MDYESIIETIKRKYLCEKYETINKREPFFEEEYEWRLGAEIVSILERKHRICISSTECICLYDIIVAIDYHNIQSIKLFKEVQHEIIN